MSVTKVNADECGIPHFRLRTARRGGSPKLFDFSSHRRAGEALKFGLGLAEPGFNIFVLGEDRSGRMTATMDFLQEAMTTRPPPADWVYLNNFRHSHRPRPYALPPGQGDVLKSDLEDVIKALKETFAHDFSAPDHLSETERRTDADRQKIKTLQEELSRFAREHHLDVQHSERGVMIVALNEDGEPVGFEEISADRRAGAEAHFETVAGKARDTLLKTQEIEDRISGVVTELQQGVAKRSLEPVMAKLRRKFPFDSLKPWFDTLYDDIIDNLDLFDDAPQPSDGDDTGVPPGPPEADRLEDRYAVNLLVDRSRDTHPRVILEPNPTYENLFGAIQYRAASGSYAAHFTLIKPGSLHKANGGVLVLRAESLVEHEESWSYLKAALRDREIRVEELHKHAGAPPIAGAPEPHGIRLDLKVVIVGTPRFYYTFFSLDAAFRNHFRVKADIDADMPATEANMATYALLLKQAAQKRIGLDLAPSATRRLLGQAARWAEERSRLTARFEQVVDALIEAGALAKAANHKTVTATHVIRAIEERRHRNSRMEDRTHERIQQREILIDTYGSRIGQVNSLTVIDHGDHTFGAPARVTAQCYVGSLGVINIERATEMSGPLQQKSVFGLEGYLKSQLAQQIPLSFSVSLTFEQNYGGIEGDSASMAELCAILSSLADAPIRQSIGVTGSMDQFGDSQAVGGITHKIEGFYRVCADQGFTGDQGIIIPNANLENLTLRDEVGKAVQEGSFHIYAIDHIAEAMQILTDLPFADTGTDTDSIMGRARTKLAKYDALLTTRNAHGASEG